MQKIPLKMHQIWKMVHQNGHCDGISISDDIRQSWTRSKAAGVNQYKRYCDYVLDIRELETLKSNNRTLLEQAEIMLGHLNQFLGETGFVFVLSDHKAGCILMRVGGQAAMAFANHSNMVEGSVWTEETMGTTSGLMASISKKPVQFFGYENYCRVASFACSASSPIFDENGEVVGIITLSGPYHLVNHHTLGMVVAASRAIERQMALKDAYEKSEVAYQHSEMENLFKTTIMDSMSEGVLTLDPEGKLTHINQIAAKCLGINYKKSIGAKLADLMAPENERFFFDISNAHKMSNETRLIKHKDEMVKLAVSCTPLIGKKGRNMGNVVILQQMKQYKRLIERLSGSQANITFDNIIGESKEFQFVIQSAKIAAESDSNVLLLGESGVGKDMFAQAIHNASSRSGEPFFAINCAALPRELISSELFGYEEGAFTGARKGGNPGKFELADQGTVFLDEIGEMPLDLQGTLLRFIEEGTLIRLGGREIIPINVRIIAASNKDLLEEVKKGNFRLDLYYRLDVINIKIPPLRDRKDDIPRLSQHFIEVIGPKLRKRIEGIEEQALELLIRYNWPGNIRELSNVIERAINFANNEVLTLHDISAEVKESGPDGKFKDKTHIGKDEIVGLIEYLASVINPVTNLIDKQPVEIDTSRECYDQTNRDYINNRPLPGNDFPQHTKINDTIILPKSKLEPSKELLEAEIIKDCLQKHKGNKKKAAQDLGISRSSLYRKIDKFSIDM